MLPFLKRGSSNSFKKNMKHISVTIVFIISFAHTLRSSNHDNHDIDDTHTRCYHAAHALCNLSMSAATIGVGSYNSAKCMTFLCAYSARMMGVQAMLEFGIYGCCCGCTCGCALCTLIAYPCIRVGALHARKALAPAAQKMQ